jgi:tetratricopeptide (TPR) repeat protein
MTRRSAPRRPARCGRTQGLAWRVLIGALCLLTAAAAVPAAAQPAPGDSIPRLIRSGDAAAALKLTDEALAHSPRDARLWTLRGLALSAMGRDDESLAAYKKALSLEPGYLPALQGAAEIEYRTRNPEAQHTLNRILTLDPANVVAHAMLGALAYERQDCATALAHFQRGDAAVQGNPTALWQAAHCLFVDGHPAQAAERFEQLLGSFGSDPRMVDFVRFNLALSLHTAGRHERAIATIEPLASREAPQREVLALLADAYAATRQVERAVGTLRRATALFPHEEQFYVALGALCLEHDAFELGREIIDIGLRNVPASARLYALRGVIHAQLGALEQAQADFERVAQMDPHQPAAVAGLSLTLQRAGQMEESIALLREQVRVRPNDATANLLLAQALQRDPSDDTLLAEARDALLRAVAAAPRLALARTELGKLYLKTGQPDQAIDQLEKAIELDPADRTATYQLLVALRRAGRQADVQKLAVRVRELLEEERASEVARNRFRLMKAEPPAARDEDRRQ